MYYPIRISLILNFNIFFQKYQKIPITCKIDSRSKSKSFFSFYSYNNLLFFAGLVGRRALYQPTHGTTRRGRPRLNYMDYIERLTGTKTDELVEVSQDREAWRELVVTCVDLQPPDYRERERESRKTSRMKFKRGANTISGGRRRTPWHPLATCLPLAD